MLKNTIFIDGAASWLPAPMTLGEAEGKRLCDHLQVRNTGMVSVCVSDRESPPEMAVLAARSALGQADCEPSDVCLVLHASVYYQGHDMWAPASYVQRLALGNRCPAMEVRQMSNGGMAALELGAAYLAADPGRTAALLTSADRFCLPGFDRWRSDPSTICGDGGTALVLSRRTGYARVRSLVTVSDPGLERAGRGDDPFGDAPFSLRAPMDMTIGSGSLVRELGLQAMLKRIEAGQREAFERAAAEAGIKFTEIDWFVLPHMGRTRMQAQYFRPFGIDPERTTWPWGTRVGHLGAGDQFAGFAQLVESGSLIPGQTCLLAGVGAGFTWTAAVVEMIGRRTAELGLPRRFCARYGRACTQLDQVSVGILEVHATAPAIAVDGPGLGLVRIRPMRDALFPDAAVRGVELFVAHEKGVMLRGDLPVRLGEIQQDAIVHRHHEKVRAVARRGPAEDSGEKRSRLPLVGTPDYGVVKLHAHV